MSRRRADDPLPVEPEGYAYDELRPLVRASLEAGLAVLLRGHPGVGKSALAGELAAEMDRPLHDVRLAQHEPAEIGGVHFPDRDRGELALYPPAWVREVCERPALVFLDELNAATTRLHQSVAYQIVLERRIGPHVFHPDTVVLAAGNLDEDRALVTPLSSALRNRFVHFVLRVDAEAWLRWAERAQLHPALLAYVRAKGRRGADVLYEDTGDDAFPTPRSWAMASRLLHHAAERDARRAVAAAVGPTAAERFFGFLRVWRRVSPRAIVERGRLPDFEDGRASEPSFRYAAVYAVADHLVDRDRVTDGQLGHVVRFLRAPGLDPEHRMLFLRRLTDRPELLERLQQRADFRELAGELVDLRMEAA